MNYFSIWISFFDNSNLFYNPRNHTIESLPEGSKMPSDWFFRARDLPGHQATCIHLAGDRYQGEPIKYHLTELRPQDPDYAEVHRHFLTLAGDR